MAMLTKSLYDNNFSLSQQHVPCRNNADPLPKQFNSVNQKNKENTSSRI